MPVGRRSSPCPQDDLNASRTTATCHRSRPLDRERSTYHLAKVRIAVSGDAIPLSEPPVRRSLAMTSAYGQGCEGGRRNATTRRPAVRYLDTRDACEPRTGSGAPRDGRARQSRGAEAIGQHTAKPCLDRCVISRRVNPGVPRGRRRAPKPPPNRCLISRGKPAVCS